MNTKKNNHNQSTGCVCVCARKQLNRTDIWRHTKNSEVSISVAALPPRMQLHINIHASQTATECQVKIKSLNQFKRFDQIVRALAIISTSNKGVEHVYRKWAKQWHEPRNGQRDVLNWQHKKPKNITYVWQVLPKLPVVKRFQFGESINEITVQLGDVIDVCTMSVLRCRFFRKKKKKFIKIFYRDDSHLKLLHVLSSKIEFFFIL